MKVYIAVRFKGVENRLEIEELCRAVRAAGMDDFCFVRDIEHYQHTFDESTALWECARNEIKKCDALLIDVTDSPSGGRVVEAGIAYALGMPIFVLAKKGVAYKDLYNGIATLIVRYEKIEDITRTLSEHLKS